MSWIPSEQSFGFFIAFVLFCMVAAKKWLERLDKGGQIKCALQSGAASWLKRKMW